MRQRLQAMCRVMQRNGKIAHFFNSDFVPKLCLTGGDCLPPRQVESPKRKRQYEHIKESELKRGASEEDVERIAVATTNKTRREKGEAKS